jgi:hypothetical protein
MTKHGDFCLPPKLLVRALIGLLLAIFVLFMGGWFTAWFAPMPMPMARDLILAAIVLLAPAYFVKVFLKHGGEEGTLWTRVAGCVSSAMIALSSLALAWGAGYGMPHHESVGMIAPLGFWILGLVAGSLVATLESVLKDERDKNREHANR